MIHCRVNLTSTFPVTGNFIIKNLRKLLLSSKVNIAYRKNLTTSVVCYNTYSYSATSSSDQHFKKVFFSPGLPWQECCNCCRLGVMFRRFRLPCQLRASLTLRSSEQCVQTFASCCRSSATAAGDNDDTMMATASSTTVASLPPTTTGTSNKYTACLLTRPAKSRNLGVKPLSSRKYYNF